MLCREKYHKATQFYSRAFKIMGNKGLPNHRYNAAIAYSIINRHDSAFKNLITLSVKTEYLDCETINSQTEFLTLKGDIRWSQVIENVCGQNQELRSLLIDIYLSDQYYRKQLDSIKISFGVQSKEWEHIWERINYTDSVNIIKIDSLYKIYGWPSKKMVGMEGNKAFWIVIQHSNLFYQEKYLIYMRDAAYQGLAEKGDLAYLEDRVLMNKNLPQKYGTQYIFIYSSGETYLYRLQDKENVNAYRRDMGLPPISEEDIKSSGKYEVK